MRSHKTLKNQVDEFTNRVVTATDQGIRQFGEYHFYDKGADEVVDINGFANELRTLEPRDAGSRLEALHQRGARPYGKVAEAIISQLDDMAEDWWSACCEACPSVKY